MASENSIEVDVKFDGTMVIKGLEDIGFLSEVHFKKVTENAENAGKSVSDLGATAGKAALDTVKSFAELVKTLESSKTGIEKFVEVAGGLSSVYKSTNELKSAFENLSKAGGGISAIISGNPFGTFVVAAAAAVAGVKMLHEHLTKLTPKGADLAKEVDGLTEKYKNLSESIDGSSKTFEERKNKLQDEITITRELQDEILTLSEHNQGHAGDMGLLNTKIEQMNDLVPGLSLAWNSETEALNLSNKAITAQIEGHKALSDLEAAGDRQLEIAMEKAEINRELNDIEQKRIEILEELAPHETYMLDINDEIIEGTETYWGAGKKLAEKLEELDKATEDYTARTEKLDEETLELNKTISESQQVAELSAQAAEEAARIQQEAADKLKAVEDQERTRLLSMNEAYDGYIKHTQNAFSGLGEPIKISLDEMVTNLKNNQQDMEDWTNNLGILADKNLDEGFMQYLRDMGPDGRLIVEEAVQSLEEGGSGAILEMQEQWLEGMESAKSGVENTFRVEDWEYLPEDAIAAMARAFAEDSSIQEEALDQIDKVYKALGRDLNEKDFYGYGEGIVQGLSKGVQENEDVFLSAMRNITLSAQNIVTSTLKINSPSRWAQEIGEYIDDGLAIGIESGTGSVTDSITDLTNNVKGNLKSAIESLSPTEDESLISVGFSLITEEDIEMENAFLQMLLAQREFYLEQVEDATTQHYTAAFEAKQKEADKEYSFVSTFNKKLVSLLNEYAPQWYNVGVSFMENLLNGLRSRLADVEALVEQLRRKLQELNSLSGAKYSGDIPEYGSGGVVTRPHLAIVGDVPEAIIPLDKLNAIITGTAMAALPSLAGAGFGGGEGVVVNQQVVISQPVESPAEMARALKRVSKELAYGL